VLGVCLSTLSVCLSVRLYALCHGINGAVVAVVAAAAVASLFISHPLILNTDSHDHSLRRLYNALDRNDDSIGNKMDTGGTRIDRSTNALYTH